MPSPPRLLERREPGLRNGSREQDLHGLSLDLQDREVARGVHTVLVEHDGPIERHQVQCAKGAADLGWFERTGRFDRLLHRHEGRGRRGVDVVRIKCLVTPSANGPRPSMNSR